MKTMLIDDDKEKVETVTTLFDDDEGLPNKLEMMSCRMPCIHRKLFLSSWKLSLVRLRDSRFTTRRGNVAGNGDVDMGIPAGAEILSPPIYATNIVSSSSSLNDADDSSFFNEEQGDTEEMGNVDVDMGIPAGAAILADLSTSSVSSSSTSVTPNDTDDSDAADTSSTYSDGDSSEENVPLHYDYDSEDIEIEVLTVEEIRRREEAAIFKDKVKQGGEIIENVADFGHESSSPISLMNYVNKSFASSQPPAGRLCPQPPEDDEDDDDDYPKEFPCTLCSAGFDTALEKEDHWRVNHFYYNEPVNSPSWNVRPLSLVNPTRRLENSEGAVSLTVNVKRKPGRPRIHRDPEPIVERKPAKRPPPNVKRKPGRPRLHPDPGPKPMVKRKPGRPRIHRDPEPEPEPKFIKPIRDIIRSFTKSTSAPTAVTGTSTKPKTELGHNQDQEEGDFQMRLQFR
ncbi:hypothetical protein Fcan01_28664 [Folsomia candida]|uniref:C2H2-type domain-containing protein n=1 Tax=Folsomia candida TaxID=158441 RepID=A0A226CW21_FOLCA|nr:hypothetical protein Fcan01_28664 [Folsomia candida]